MCRKSLRVLPIIAAFLFAVASSSNAQHQPPQEKPARGETEEALKRRKALLEGRLTPAPIALEPGAITRDLTLLPPGWKYPHRDRQERFLIGWHHPVVVEVLLDDQNHLRVVRDGIPGPPFDDIRVELLARAPISGHVAYVGVRGEEHFVGTSSGDEFPCPRFADMHLALSDVGSTVAYILRGVRGVEGATLYINGEQVFRDQVIGPVTFGSGAGLWATVVAGQCTAGNPGEVRLLTHRGLGPPEYRQIKICAWSPVGERMLYTGGSGSIVLLEGLEEVSRWSSPSGYTHVMPGTELFSPDSRQVAWVGSTSYDGTGAHPLIDGKPVTFPKDESLRPPFGLQWWGEPSRLVFRTQLPDQRTAVRAGEEVLAEGFDAGGLVVGPRTGATHWLTSRRVASEPVLVWIHAGVAGPYLATNQHVSLALSPDGNHFAYSARLLGETQHSLVVDGKSLAGPRPIAAHIAFAPDSSRLAYFSEAGLTLITFRGDEASDIRSLELEPDIRWEPIFTANSQHVAYVGKRFELCGDGRAFGILKTGPVRPHPAGHGIYDLDRLRMFQHGIQRVGPSSVRVLQATEPVNGVPGILETVVDLAAVGAR